MFNPATEQIMKKRIFYIISFLVIFCMEVLIALYVRDRFIRPYVGDMLVVVLVYSFVRIFLPTGIPRMPFYVFLFACFVEVLQYFQLVETLAITEPPPTGSSKSACSRRQISIPSYTFVSTGLGCTPPISQ